MRDTVIRKCQTRVEFLVYFKSISSIQLVIVSSNTVKKLSTDYDDEPMWSQGLQLTRERNMQLLMGANSLSDCL